MNWRVMTGNVLDMLPTLPDASVQCCVTSPPYWGLRDYGTASWSGGSSECDHKGTPLASSSSSLAGYTSDNVKMRTFTMPQGQTCSKCGAHRIDSQIGLESTPDAYVAQLVAVFREVRRVLKDDGVLWCNLGDSYASGGKGGGGSFMAERGDAAWQSRSSVNGWRPAPPGLKHKDLVGVPWMVAFALRADGWYLRQEIIWAKPNPMPESVQDRCTKAHEQVFLLTKKPRYYFDAGAIQEDGVIPAGTMAAKGSVERSGIIGVNSRPPEYKEYDGKRNRRSVWTVNTHPYPEAHFATYPPDLIRPMILAGSRLGDTVLDPFTGSGTTGEVAIQEGRSFIGCELNPAYVELARKRIGNAAPLFATEATA